MKNKKTVLLSVVLLILGFVFVTKYYQKDQEKQVQKLSVKSHEIPFVRDHSPVFGKNEKNVVIVEFMDPQCGACKRFHPTIKKLFREYGNETKLVIRYLASHKDSKYAVRLLEAARLQGKFNEALEVIFKYQDKWGDHYDPNVEILWDLLPEAGLDMMKLKMDFESNYIDGILSLDLADAKKLKVRGTPTVFVNGKEVKKLDYESLLGAVESEIYK